MKKRNFFPLNGMGKYGPKSFWTEEMIKKIIGEPKYQKLYLIPNTLIPNKKIV